MLKHSYERKPFQNWTQCFNSETLLKIWSENAQFSHRYDPCVRYQTYFIQLGICKFLVSTGNLFGQKPGHTENDFERDLTSASPESFRYFALRSLSTSIPPRDVRRTFQSSNKTFFIGKWGAKIKNLDFRVFHNFVNLKSQYSLFHNKGISS